MTLPLHLPNALTACAGNYPATTRLVLDISAPLESFYGLGINMPIYTVAKDKKSVAGFTVKVRHSR